MLCVCVCVRAERTAPDCPRRSLCGIFWVRHALDKERYRPIYFFTTGPLVRKGPKKVAVLILRIVRRKLKVRLLQLIDAGEHLLHLPQVSEW